MPNSCWFLVSPLIDLYYLNPYWFITLQHTYKHTYAQTTNMWTFWNNVCTSLFCTEMSLRTLLQTSWFTSDSFQNEAQKWPCQRFYRATRPRWRRWVLCTEEVCGGGIDHPQTLLITGRRAIYPSSNKTLTLTSYLWQNDGLGEGWVGRLEDPWIFGWVSKRFLKPLPREIFDLPQRLESIHLLISVALLILFYAKMRLIFAVVCPSCPCKIYFPSGNKVCLTEHQGSNIRNIDDGGRAESPWKRCIDVEYI